MKNKRDKYSESTTAAFIEWFRECHDVGGIPPNFAETLAWLGGPERYHWPLKAFREVLRRLSQQEDGSRYLLWASYLMIDRIEDDGVFIETARSFFSGCQSRFSRPSAMSLPGGPIMESAAR